MKLHYAPRTRASRVRWLLEELGAVHELDRINIQAGQHKTPEYKAMHPHGSLPAFTWTDEGVTMIESAAICLAIADKYPEKGLAPKPGTLARALYYQWIVYVPATIEPCITAFAKASQLPEDQRDHATQNDRARWNEIAAFIEKHLSDNDYIVEDTFSVADIILSGSLNWANMYGLLEGHPTLQAYTARLRARPAFQRANND
jgi:glutathione S-transferase